MVVGLVMSWGREKGKSRNITYCIERNIEHELLVAQWDSLKIAWVLLREAIE